MKQEELQIGDWVWYNPNIFNEDEYELPKECYPTKIESGEDIDLAIEGCYEPIPLTPEILEKNGFEKNGSYYILNECIEDGEDVIEHYEIIYYNDGFCSVQNIVTEDEISFYCPNVHQLQQAMRLCGIDKEIIL